MVIKLGGFFPFIANNLFCTCALAQLIDPKQTPGLPKRADRRYLIPNIESAMQTALFYPIELPFPLGFDVLH